MVMVTRDAVVLGGETSFGRWGGAGKLQVATLDRRPVTMAVSELL